MAELGKAAGAELTYELGEDSDGCPVVRLRGELDMTTAPKLETALEPIVTTAPDRLVVDASELKFADSSAIALLVRWANMVRHVEIRQPPDLLQRVIVRMGLADRLDVRP
ncbi:MAG TPA: STAS domain-containing protein [Solirubrobacteraceae bacterium]|nr:STAS domain-containing protein [Solirubrobacteraceae bacterium]